MRAAVCPCRGRLQSASPADDALDSAAAAAAAAAAAERECVSVSNVASTMVTLLLGNPLLPVVSAAGDSCLRKHALNHNAQSPV
jgi:hypothetical protein